MGARGALKRGVRDLERVADRVGPDTVKLWDSYREQALLWRAIALLQLPALFFASILALITFFYSDQVVEAPPKPEPAFLSVNDISDQDFILKAKKLVSLLTSYQPETAERQFEIARKSLWEPALSAFNKEFLQKQIRIIEETKRSQLFYFSEKQIKLTRGEDFVEARIPGERQKLIGKTPMPSDQIAWYIKFTTIPRNELNQLGIVVIDLKPVSVSLEQLAHEDHSKGNK